MVEESSAVDGGHAAHDRMPNLRPNRHARLDGSPQSVVSSQ